MPLFTPHQDAALTAASKWFKAERGKTSIFRLFGYAGTGKTTLARHIAAGIDGKVLFAIHRQGGVRHAQQRLPRRIHHSPPDLQAAGKE
jgi:SpoVK/Ycf46/Vps4 family AAA+-type ATPase